MDAVRDPAAKRPLGDVPYVQRRPEETLLYQVIDDNYPDFIAQPDAQGRALPKFVRREFEDYLKCGRLEHGFLRVRCGDCHAEKLVAFSCKRRGFCPSCGARRMVESAALLVDEVLPRVPLRQWVLSVPYPLRFLFASNSAAMGEALSIMYRAISGFLLGKAKLTRREAQCGAVTLIQRFGSALNLNVHFHMLIPDGVQRISEQYRDGTTHVLFEPLDFLARLAALVPSPGVNLTRYPGVFAPNHCLRAQIVPTGAAATAQAARALRPRSTLRCAGRSA